LGLGAGRGGRLLHPLRGAGILRPSAAGCCAVSPRSSAPAPICRTGAPVRRIPLVRPASCRRDLSRVHPALVLGGSAPTASLWRRNAACVVFVAVSVDVVPGSATVSGSGAPTAKTCFFVRNRLPCPCPKAQQARAVAHAAYVTVDALGIAAGKTAAALARTQEAPTK